MHWSTFCKHGIQGTEYFVLKFEFVLKCHYLIYLLSRFFKKLSFKIFLLQIWFQHGWQMGECIFSCFSMSWTYNFRNYFACWEEDLFLFPLIFITLYRIIIFILSLGISSSARNTFSHLFASERKQRKDSPTNFEKDCVILTLHGCHNIILTV